MKNVDSASCASFEKNGKCPDIIGLDMTADDVSEMAPKLNGASSLTSVDVVAFSSMFLCFALALVDSKEEMAHWTEHLANIIPSWVTYMTTMASHLLVTDKIPWVRPFGIGEIYYQLWAKLVIKDCGSEAKIPCGTLQLCAWFEIGRDGAIHSVNQKSNYSNSLSLHEHDVNTIATSKMQTQ